MSVNLKSSHELYITMKNHNPRPDFLKPEETNWLDPRANLLRAGQDLADGEFYLNGGKLRYDWSGAVLLRGFNITIVEYYGVHKAMVDELSNNDLYKAKMNLRQQCIRICPIQDRIYQKFTCLRGQEGSRPPTWWAKLAVSQWFRRTAGWMLENEAEWSVENYVPKIFLHIFKPAPLPEDRIWYFNYEPQAMTAKDGHLQTAKLTLVKLNREKPPPQGFIAILDPLLEDLKSELNERHLFYSKRAWLHWRPCVLPFQSKQSYIITTDYELEVTIETLHAYGHKVVLNLEFEEWSRRDIGCVIDEYGGEILENAESEDSEPDSENCFSNREASVILSSDGRNAGNNNGKHDDGKHDDGKHDDGKQVGNYGGQGARFFTVIMTAVRMVVMVVMISAMVGMMEAVMNLTKENKN